MATCGCGEQFPAQGAHAEALAFAAADRHLAEMAGDDLPPLSDAQLDVVAGVLRGHDRRITAQAREAAEAAHPGGSEAPEGAPPR